ncbi:MAG TPA: alpha-amylase, partial [Thiobacillus sp.]
TVSERGRLRVNLGDQLVLKSYRRLLAGVHPELEMSRFLTDTAKFAHIPQLIGTVEDAGADGHGSTFAILERYAENQGTAWTYTLNYLERFLDACRASPDGPPDTRHAAYLGSIRTLGLRTAEFHQALALPDAAGAFGTAPITANDIADWVNDVQARMESVFDLLEREMPLLPESARLTGSELTGLRPRLYRLIMRASSVRPDGLKTRYHGDYSLAQIWLAGNDFLIANYGGEPGRPWAERRRKHSPLRDVAGMMLSFTAVGAAAMEHVAGDSVEALAALQAHVDAWGLLARRTFFRSYRKALARDVCPADARALESLLSLFLAERTLDAVETGLAQHSSSVGSALRWLIQVAQRRR